MTKAPCNAHSPTHIHTFTHTHTHTHTHAHGDVAKHKGLIVQVFTSGSPKLI